MPDLFFGVKYQAFVLLGLPNEAPLDPLSCIPRVPPPQMTNQGLTHGASLLYGALQN